MWDTIVKGPIIDLLDILIVAWLLYRLLRFVRNTRAVQMVVGLALLLILSWVASTLGMIVVGRIIRSLQTVWVVAFIILFQPELRSALANFGMQRRLHLLRGRSDELPGEGEILKTVERLSRRGLGALIVLEREISLDRWVRTGTALNAEIHAATLETIFTVPAPLHDGAVIIRDGKIAAAGCTLPPTEREAIGYTLGLRHRAAIGLSEVSDAIVIVVSEETRSISLVYGGEIKRGLTIEDLRTEIGRVLFAGGRKRQPAEVPA
ncbi:MAG TPA: diadenylate cyclase CdaA [Candidatus Krumholzibacteria bacterium]|nr:diadenylate cyclase CdaA [Candidatus Krumholzibacteria bacterium]HPD70901.1 diadenylate cyclase CdaA [Candidatus Krumholzibacteria bacterium]HRY39399.1 diadenylate cyclase CdaA [Candidatus Krumholzibacteria bacterium]